MNPPEDSTFRLAMPAPPPRPDEAILAAGRRLAIENGADFTTQDLILEAGVSLQTFYRYFGKKDQLILAVLRELVGEYVKILAVRTAAVDDPVDRLEVYIRSTLDLVGPDADLRVARFITGEHWRLQQVLPEGINEAIKPFADLICRELILGEEIGRLAPRHPERDAWVMANTVLSAFHQLASLPSGPNAATVADDVWQFCLAAVVRSVPPRLRRRRGANN